MGVVTHILDAFRRWGSPTQRSALSRQDEYVANKTVLERRRTTVPGPLGPVEGFVATIAPFEESVSTLSHDELVPILGNAESAIEFVATFASALEQQLTLNDMDSAFSAWIAATDQRGYTAEAVIELLGAAFGNYCVERLNMRWVQVSDADGTALAVDGIRNVFRCYPYHSISKRLAAGETGFFVGVFALLEDMAREAVAR